MKKILNDKLEEFRYKGSDQLQCNNNDEAIFQVDAQTYEDLLNKGPAL